MARSIFDTFGLALTLAFALPVAYAGVTLLSEGRTALGLALLGIAVLMVAVEEYLTTPMDVPGMVAGKVLGTAVKEPEETADGEPDADARPESRGDETAPTESTAGDDGGNGDGNGGEGLIPDAEEQ